MKRSFLSILFILSFKAFIGQADTSTFYKGLERKKFYSVSQSAYISGGYAEYKVNDRVVDKATYDKYMATWKNMETCCPCILESYDENDVLLSESISCTDCGVGWFKEYYPNGKHRLTGKYKENPTGNGKGAWNMKYCNVEVGEWIYYSENGERIYSEFWNDGTFVKQVPEQPKAEIWDFVLLLNEIKIDSQKIPIDEIKNLKVIPKYKNRNTFLDLRIEFEVSAEGYKIVKKEFSPERFKDIDVNKMLEEAGIPREEKTSFLLTAFTSDKMYWRYFYLKIVK